MTTHYETLALPREPSVFASAASAAGFCMSGSYDESTTNDDKANDIKNRSTRKRLSTKFTVSEVDHEPVWSATKGHLSFAIIVA
jgi:hypothetical protein